MATLNRGETAALSNAIAVMENVAKAIRNGTVTANHAEHLEAAQKQVKTVWIMKGKYE